MTRQYKKQIWVGKSARTLELLQEEQEPKTPVDILIEAEEDGALERKYKHFTKRIKKVLTKISKRQRQCIELYFLKNMRITDIAKRLSITKQAVNIYLKRAIKSLKNLL